MSFKSDYGLRLLKDGASKQQMHDFYDFRLYSVTLLRGGQFSTMADMMLDGELHALSLDFAAGQLVQIMVKTSPELASFIVGEQARDPHLQRAIDFDGEIEFGVAAQLGKEQQAGTESSVPLVDSEIF
ncbi:hypothetical protein N9V88_00405 [bacterium]|nr:hypothetical protein [bacterium]